MIIQNIKLSERVSMILIWFIIKNVKTKFSESSLNQAYIVGILFSVRISS